MGPQPPNKRSGGGDGSAPTGGDNRPATAPPFHARRPAATYYKPSVHQLTCRGAFHLQNHATARKKGARDTLQTGEDLEDILKDTFVCHGIQSRLRHVADYPLARNKDEAVRWFEGTAAPMGVEVHIDEGHGDDHMDDEDRGGDDGGGGGGDKRRGGTAVSHGKYLDVAPADVSFSSYGTTQVNVLTVQEVPVNPHEFAPRSLLQDPFGGFGFGGMLNPFGSLFGGFFGGGPPPGSGGGEVDPWFQPPGGEDASADNHPNNHSNNQNGGEWPSSRGARSVSRSVSSSTRMERDDQGKRVVTTVTKTTIVDNTGGKRTETVTTKKHVDEGGRVETKKVVEADGKTVRESGGRGASHSADRRSVPGRAVDAAAATHPHLPSAAGQASTPEPGPTEVAVIATDCLLGVSISDSAIADPNGGGTSTPPPPAKDTAKDGGSGDSVAGWRKSEYLFRLGRFVPPFMVVNKYYQDKEEEERRRMEMRREYDDLRERMKRGRWDRAKEQDKDDNDATNKGLGTSRTPMESQDTPIADSMSTASSRAEYFLQRLSVQMGKNLDMMGTLSHAMTRPDFPRKVYAGGQKIFENLGPTAERTGKLMGDVWEMWTGAFRGGQR